MANHVAHQQDDPALTQQDRTIIAFTRKLTVAPSDMTSDDLQGLRDAGLTEEQALDVVLITSLFNFMNRLANGLGVQLSAGAISYARQWLDSAPGEQWRFLALPEN